MELKSKKAQPAKFKLPEVRCFWCNRLLFRGIVENVEIKCPRCNAVQYIGSYHQSVPLQDGSQEGELRQSR